MSASASGLVYVALTALLFRNLLPDITTHLSSDLGDPLLVTSILAWSAKHLPLTETWWNFPGFAPLLGATAFTEHLLLTYPVTAPIIWLTSNPVLAYNIMFLLVWPLNALAAFALAREVTGSPRAAFIGGLAFGFAPYLPDHLSHLQLLLAFGMPLGLLGLHRYLRTNRWRDAAIFGAGWLATAIANAYTLMFFPVLAALWCLWFVRPREWKRLAAPLAAALIASVPLIPLLYGYAARQAAFGFTRSYGDAKLWAADVTALIGVSSREWLWAGWLPNNYGESSIFPGLTIVSLAILAVAACGAGLTRPAAQEQKAPRRTAWSRGLLASGAALTLIVLARMWAGDAGWHVGAMALPAFRPYKAFTFAVVLLIAAVCMTERFRAGWSRRDVALFYAVAAVFFWLLALGPEPTWLGHRILTYGPYRLFFEFHAPVVVRVSARAWLGALPCLAVLAAFGARFLIDRVPRHPNAFVGTIAVLIAAESWFVAGTKAVPSPMPPGAIPPGATVLDVPLDDAFMNAAAQYRGVRGDYRTINGYSGYDSPPLVRLILAFRARRYELVDTYRQGDLYVIVRPDADPSFVQWLGSRSPDRPSDAAGAAIYHLRSNGVR